MDTRNSKAAHYGGYTLIWANESAERSESPVNYLIMPTCRQVHATTTEVVRSHNLKETLADVEPGNNLVSALVMYAPKFLLVK